MYKNGFIRFKSPSITKKTPTLRGSSPKDGKTPKEIEIKTGKPLKVTPTRRRGSSGNFQTPPSRLPVIHVLKNVQ